MSTSAKIFAYNSEIDEVIRYLTKSEYQPGELNNIDNRIETLYNKYDNDQEIGTDRYKLYLAEALVNCRASNFDEAMLWLDGGLEPYGSKYPNYSKVKDLIHSEYNSYNSNTGTVTMPVYDGPVLKLIKHTGLLLAWQQTTYSYSGSPENLSEKFYGVQLHNIFLGWWSTFSILLNPLVIIVNVVNWLKYRHDYRKWSLTGVN